MSLGGDEMLARALLTVAASGSILLGVSSANAASSNGVTAKYMGAISCGSWVGYSENEQVLKAAALNLVLGYLLRASWDDRQDLLKNTDTQSVTLWMDNYCRANPLSDVVAGAFHLEQALRPTAPSID
jgi:hypothetical protein